jgi:NAD(P)H-hydrate epimerase
MENAASGLAGIVLEELERATGGGRVLVICGAGSNGGDGLAAARHLSNAGVEVWCLLEREVSEFRGDALVQARVCQAMGLPLGTLAGVCNTMDRKWNVVVDAIVGTGLRGSASAPMAELIALVNELGEEGARVIAVDVPSGLDCDTGLATGPVVRADVTVTFVGPKAGFLALSAQEHLGDIVVVDIGAPRFVVESCATWDEELELGEWTQSWAEAEDEGADEVEPGEDEEDAGPGRRPG